MAHLLRQWVQISHSSIEQGEKTINSGVYVKGLTEGGHDDFYGIIEHIYELEYNSSSSPKKVVVFYC